MSSNDLVLFYLVDSSKNYKSKEVLEMLQACLIMSYFGVTPKSAKKCGKTASGGFARSL